MVYHGVMFIFYLIVLVWTGFNTAAVSMNPSAPLWAIGVCVVFSVVQVLLFAHFGIPHLVELLIQE